jgi:hypothetical protein
MRLDQYGDQDVKYQRRTYSITQVEGLPSRPARPISWL